MVRLWNKQTLEIYGLEHQLHQSDKAYILQQVELYPYFLHILMKLIFYLGFNNFLYFILTFSAI